MVTINIKLDKQFIQTGIPGILILVFSPNIVFFKQIWNTFPAGEPLEMFGDYCTEVHLKMSSLCMSPTGHMMGIILFVKNV